MVRDAGGDERQVRRIEARHGRADGDAAGAEHVADVGDPLGRDVGGALKTSSGDFSRGGFSCGGFAPGPCAAARSIGNLSGCGGSGNGIERQAPGRAGGEALLDAKAPGDLAKAEVAWSTDRRWARTPPGG